MEGLKMKIASYSIVTPNGSISVKAEHMREFAKMQKALKIKSKAAMISGLKAGKTYYIRVRGYKLDAYGNYYYTPYSKMKKVTVTK